MEIVISMLLLLVGVIFLVIIHVCIVGRVLGRAYEDGDEIIDDDNSRRSRSNNGDKKIITIEDLKKLSSFDYKETEDEIYSLDCVVCLENFKIGEKCRVLPICKHNFHAECIDSWLLKAPICPICRSYVNLSNVGVSAGVGGERKGAIASGRSPTRTPLGEQDDSACLLITNQSQIRNKDWLFQ